MEDEDDMSKLFNLYEYTNNSNQKIDNDNLRSDLKANNINMSLTKMKQMLKTKGDTNLC